MLPVICDACNTVFVSKLILPSSFQASSVPTTSGQVSRCPSCGHANDDYRTREAKEILLALCEEGLSAEQVRRLIEAGRDALSAAPNGQNDAVEKLKSQTKSGLPFRVWPNSYSDRVALLSLMVALLTLMENIGGDWSNLVAFAKPDKAVHASSSPSRGAAGSNSASSLNNLQNEPLVTDLITIDRPAPGVISRYRGGVPTRYSGRATFSAGLSLWYFQLVHVAATGERRCIAIPISRQSGRWSFSMTYGIGPDASKSLAHLITCLSSRTAGQIEQSSEVSMNGIDEELLEIKKLESIGLIPPMLRFRYDSLDIGGTSFAKLLISEVSQAPTSLAKALA